VGGFWSTSRWPAGHELRIEAIGAEEDILAVLEKKLEGGEEKELGVGAAL